MYKGKKIIALIPARGGSKGLAKKNIKQLSGKPLIAWTIEQAIKSQYIDRVVVSTESKDIANIAKKYGAVVPFLRPKRFATDKAKSTEVVLHAINWFKKNKEYFDLLILLQPTSPLRQYYDVDKAVELLFTKKAQSVVSVCEVGHHPYWSNTLPKDGCMKNFIKKETVNKNRQTLPVFYRLNGAIYLAYCDYFLKNKSFFGAKTYAYKMPQERSIDIDIELNFQFAEYLMKRIIIMQKSFNRSISIRSWVERSDLI